MTKVSDLPKIKTKSSLADDLKAVNLKYDPKDSNYSSNCGFCATAFELRRRGFDVEALGNPIGMTVVTPYKMFDNPSIKYISGKDLLGKFYRETHGWENGQRGMINAWWKEGSAHAFSFEIIDESPQIVDAQVNSENVAAYFQRAKVVNFFRTDNLETLDWITKAVAIKK